MAEDCVSLIPGVAKLIADKGIFKLCGCNLVTLRLSAPAQQLRQLGDVEGDPPRLIAGDALAVSLNHLVGCGEQHGRHGDAQRCGCLQVDHQIELLRAPYRQLAWVGTVRDFSDVVPASSEYLG